MTAGQLGGRNAILAAVAASLGLAYLTARSPALAVAPVAGLIFLAWIVTRAELVLMVLVAAIPWEAMLAYPSATLSVTKLLGLALAAAYVFRATTRGESLRFPGTVIASLLLGIAIGLSLIVSTDPASGLVKGFRYAFFIVFLFLVTQLVADRQTLFRLLRVFCLSAAAAGLFGLVAFLSGAVGRASGPLEDANDFAYLMATVVPIAVLLFLEDRRLRPLWGTALAILLAAAFATLSRGALVGLGALLAWAILSRRVGAGGLVWTAGGVVALLALALTLWSPLINERLEEKSNIGAQNVDSRIAYWSAAAQMAAERPVLGVGPERFGAEAGEYLRDNPIALQNPVVHNTYLEILAENGALALGAFLALLAAAWQAASRKEREVRALADEQGIHMVTAIKGMLIVAIVSGLFLSEQLTVPFWLAFGLAGSGAFLVRRAGPAKAPA